MPDELPPSSLGSELTVIDLDKMSHEDLMEMSRASAPDPLGALLPIAPGILPEREAHLTGTPSSWLTTLSYGCWPHKLCAP